MKVGFVGKDKRTGMVILKRLENSAVLSARMECGVRMKIEQPFLAIDLHDVIVTLHLKLVIVLGHQGLNRH